MRCIQFLVNSENLVFKFNLEKTKTFNIATPCHSATVRIQHTTYNTSHIVCMFKPSILTLAKLVKCRKFESKIMSTCIKCTKRWFSYQIAHAKHILYDFFFHRNTKYYMMNLILLTIKRRKCHSRRIQN